MLCAAEMLEGAELPNGWKVLAKIQPESNSTGGHFSVPYVVERREGRLIKRAFLKALNFRRLAAEKDFARAMQQHAAVFNFERDTLDLCRERGLRRVATLLDAGEHRTPNNPLPVCYIIFELAEGGDARKQVATLGRISLAWKLRTLHHIAVGLKQLHTHGIAHQDLKPSNVLFFGSFGAKVGDLGCADIIEEANQSPRGHLGIPGDPSYAPIELFYNEYSIDWKTRRLGCDLYLFGSLAVFFFTGGGSMTAILQSHLHSSHFPANWTHDYRAVLPYVFDAFERSLNQIAMSVPESVRPHVISIIRHLCHPDPKKRGHPEDLNGSQFNLERIVSSLDLLATRAEYQLVKE